MKLLTFLLTVFEQFSVLIVLKRSLLINKRVITYVLNNFNNN